MTLISQEVVRDLLVTYLKTVALLADEAGGTAHVVGYFVEDPRGISPFCCVDSAGADYDVKGDSSKLTKFRFVVGFWVRRDEDPAAAEDHLNTLALALTTTLRKYFIARYTNPPSSDFELIDGKPYKFELHFCEIER